MHSIHSGQSFEDKLNLHECQDNISNTSKLLKRISNDVSFLDHTPNTTNSPAKVNKSRIKVRVRERKGRDRRSKSKFRGASKKRDTSQDKF